jgi:hypothetical protein
MITEVKGKNNFVDALATAMHYAVLTKNGRIQILIRPRPKQLRKRGQRGWQLFGTIDSEAEADVLLNDMLKRALRELQSNGAEREKPKKIKARL